MAQQGKKKSQDLENVCATFIGVQTPNGISLFGNVLGKASDGSNH